MTYDGDAHDTLQIGALYDSRRLTAPPWPAWLAIPDAVYDLSQIDLARHS